MTESGIVICPHCPDDREIKRRGYVPHATKAHDVPAEVASQELEELKREAELRERVESVGGVEAADDSPAGPSGSADEPEHVRGDRLIQELDREVAATERQVRLQKLREMAEGDDLEDVERVIKLMRELNDLQDSGRDNSGMDTQLILSELRDIRESGGMAPTPVGGDGGLLSIALQAGVDDPEIIGEIAQQSPEAKMAEYEMEKERVKLEHRKEMIDTVFDALANADVAGLAGRAVASVLADRMGDDVAAGGGGGAERGDRRRVGGRGRARPEAPERRPGRAEPSDKRSPMARRLEGELRPVDGGERGSVGAEASGPEEGPEDAESAPEQDGEQFKIRGPGDKDW